MNRRNFLKLVSIVPFIGIATTADIIVDSKYKYVKVDSRIMTEYFKIETTDLKLFKEKFNEYKEANPTEKINIVVSETNIFKVQLSDSTEFYGKKLQYFQIKKG